MLANGVLLFPLATAPLLSRPKWPVFFFRAVYARRDTQRRDLLCFLLVYWPVCRPALCRVSWFAF
jgi:hypothetical protein